MPPMNTDGIPTEPTTDHEPPSVTSLTPGPSQVPTSPAGGRGGRAVLIGAIVGLALVVTFSAGIGVGRLVLPMGAPAGTIPNPAAGPAASAPTEFGLIKEAWDTLHQQYVARDELNDRELIYGAIDGMTEAVGDTGHTDFMTPEERKERDDALSGSYVGIGVRIDETEEGLPRVVSVFKGSPAEAAGLKADDVIIAVDGRETAGAVDRRDRRLGPRRGGHERRADDPERRHRAHGPDRSRRRPDRAGVVDDGAGLDDRPHPPGAVLVGCRR